jgi:hypothetical protein
MGVQFPQGAPFFRTERLVPKSKNLRPGVFITPDTGFDFSRNNSRRTPDRYLGQVPLENRFPFQRYD